jgi:tRNA-dihydrouridine synthase C
MFIARGQPALVLAPMDGVTDSLMRRLLTRRMPLSYCVTEFIRVSGLVPPDKTFLLDVPELRHDSRTQSGAAVQVQLLGGDPDRLAQSAQRAVALGAQGIDLNFGCPAPTVNKHDGGATLLKFPERVEKIVSAVRSAVSAGVPVSAKLRLGWDDPRAIHVNAERAARGGASWITIHGRTKMQGYTPPAYWEPIGEVRRALDIPVVANGEIWSVDDLKRCQDQSGGEHFMIGRGALAEPGLITTLAAALGIPVRDDDLALCGGDAEKWRPLLHELIELSRAEGEAERRTISRVKQWLNYARHKGSVRWFDSLKRLESLEAIVAHLDELVLAERSDPERRAA